MEYYKLKNKKNKNLEIKIKEINNITDMRSMFFGCLSLINLPDISKWNTNNVTNMSFMFYECSKSLNIPDKFK